MEGARIFRYGSFGKTISGDYVYLEINYAHLSFFFETLVASDDHCLNS